MTAYWESYQYLHRVEECEGQEGISLQKGIQTSHPLDLEFWALPFRYGNVGTYSLRVKQVGPWQHGVILQSKN